MESRAGVHHPQRCYPLLPYPRRGACAVGTARDHGPMIRYVSAFLLSAIIPLLFAWNPLAPVLVLPAILFLLLGSELIARKGAVPEALQSPVAYRALPWLYI